MMNESGTDRPASTSNAVGRQVVRYISVTLIISAVLATVFTSWTPASLRPNELAAGLMAAVGSNATDKPAAGLETEAADDGRKIKIGIVAGHSGLNPESGLPDPGAVCPDGLTEAEVNKTIAELTVQGLEAAGFEVELLEEFDSRLPGYKAVALVSIHADVCLWINEEATGYKVTSALDTAIPDRAQKLVSCIVDRYGRATGLQFHPGSVTRDMTEYHSFYEINSQTPAAVIETGFLYLDREFLTQSPEKAAQGIVEGLLCYINNEPINLSGSE